MGLARWLAIAIGLVGVVIMVQPDAGDFSWFSILPVLAALTYSVMQMVTRKLGMRDSAGTLTFYIQIAFIIISILTGLTIGDGRFNTFDQPALEFLLRAWHWPNPLDFGLLAACGVIVAFGTYLLSQSYRIAQASILAPFEYTSLPLAVLVGFLVWGDLPGVKDIFGCLLIVGSGLLVVVYESRSKQKLAPSTPPG